MVLYFTVESNGTTEKGGEENSLSAIGATSVLVASFLTEKSESISSRVSMSIRVWDFMLALFQLQFYLTLESSTTLAFSREKKTLKKQCVSTGIVPWIQRFPHETEYHRLTEILSVFFFCKSRQTISSR